MMGRRITAQTLSRNDGQSNYGSLTSIGESPLDARVIYTGSDDGQVLVKTFGYRPPPEAVVRPTDVPFVLKTFATPVVGLLADPAARILPSL